MEITVASVILTVWQKEKKSSKDLSHLARMHTASRSVTVE